MPQRRTSWARPVTIAAALVAASLAPAADDGLLARWTKGENGGPRAFDGRSTFVPLGDLGEFPAITIAFWMKPANAAKSDDWQGLVSSDGWEEGVFPLSVRRSVVDVWLHLGGNRRGRLASPKLRSNTRYHVALTADRASRRMFLYVNGAEQDVADISALKTQFKLVKQVVGREFGGRYFAGEIDGVRVYSRALSAKEVRALCPNAPPLLPRDLRNIRAGHRIPAENYCDQPYVVVTKEGHWLCTLTTGPGHEGASGEHMVAAVSTDQGRTWSGLIPIEPGDGPASSYGSPLITPSGRIYVFYGYNGDRVETFPDGKKVPRADMLGWFVYKYSDDGGRTWSRERHRLPMRLTPCDLANQWGGKVQIFWGIDKPKIVRSHVYFAFTKLGRYMLDDGEGWLYHSDNVLTERDPAKIRWELLPDGDHGIRAPQFGSVQEEHNMVPLAGGKTLYCVYRTTTGYPCHTYSRDGGHTWDTPEHMTYAPGGRKLKTNRACPKLWRCASGKFLFWFHNHSGKSYEQRNPAWITGGVERDGYIHWSQPEILLYDPDPNMRMSYPDLVEQDGRYWVTETQKTIARVHEIDPTLLEGLWAAALPPGTAKDVTRKGLVLDTQDREVALPKPVDTEESGGVTLDLWLKFDSLAPYQVLLNGEGVVLATTERGTVQLELTNGKTRFAFDCDAGLLQPNKLHHLAIILDAGPRTVTFVVDGVLCDGGESRQFGWARYPDALEPKVAGKLKLAPSIRHLRVYDRYLRTSEAVANFRSGI